MKLLGEETLVLSSLLQRHRDRVQVVRHDEAWLPDHKDGMRQFQAAYDDLAMTLKYDAVSSKIRDESKPKSRPHNRQMIFLQVGSLLSSGACHSTAAACQCSAREQSAHASPANEPEATGT